MEAVFFNSTGSSCLYTPTTLAICCMIELNTQDSCRSMCLVSNFYTRCIVILLYHLRNSSLSFSLSPFSCSYASNSRPLSAPPFPWLQSSPFDHTSPRPTTLLTFDCVVFNINFVQVSPINAILLLFLNSFLLFSEVTISPLRVINNGRDLGTPIW